MARTMSCGELKNTKFFASSGQVSFDGKKGQSFQKVTNKDLESNKNSKDSKEVYQIRGGARIVKLDSEAKYKEFRKEICERLGKDASSLDLNKEGLESALKQAGGIYDGVIIGDNLAGKFNDPLLQDAGVKIFNPEVVVSEKEEYTPYRDNFNARGTDISDNMKNMCSDLYKQRETVDKALSEQDKINYSVDDSGKITSTQLDGTSEDVTKVVSDAAEEITKQTGVEIRVAEQGASGDKSDAVVISATESLRLTDMCRLMGDNQTSLGQVMLGLMLYQHVMNSNDVPDSSYVSFMADLLKSVGTPTAGATTNPPEVNGAVSGSTTSQGENNAVGSNTGADTGNNTPDVNGVTNVNVQNQGENNIAATTNIDVNTTDATGITGTFSALASLLKATTAGATTGTNTSDNVGTTKNVNGNMDKIASGNLTSSFDSLVSAKKEELHREKMRWDKVIKNAPEDQRKALESVAKAHMAKQMNEYVSLKKSGKGELNLGDMKVNCNKNTEANSTSNTKTTSGLSSVRDELRKSREEARKGIRDAYNGVITGFKNSGKILGTSYGRVISRVGNIIKGHGDGIQDKFK